jgi:hypothetical protein
MAEQDQKQKQQKQPQQQKQKQPQGKPAGKPGLEEKEPVVYERPTPYGWYTIVFPRITSEQDYHMALWVDEALSWVRTNIKQPFFWAFAHGTKKDGDKTSPVFFFKDREEALRTSWYLSGELVTEKIT